MSTTEIHNKTGGVCNRTTERVRIWRRTLAHPRRDGKNWYEYAAWVNAGAHAFRKARGLRLDHPIGRMPEFDEFLRTFEFSGLDNTGQPFPF